MSQRNRAVGVAILERPLVIELKHVPGRIERARAVFVHGEMGHRLVAEEIWLALDLQEALDGEGPIEFLE